MGIAEKLHLLLGLGIVAGAVFSFVAVSYRRGVFCGILCGLSTALILVGLTMPIWMTLGGIMFSLR
jgi:hypothetical protein